MALIRAIQAAPGKFDELHKDIEDIKDPQLRALLGTLYTKAAGNIDKFQHELANWFDDGMGRVSGIYKKWSQAWCFLIALAIAVIFNIDSVHLFKTLWQHPSLIAQVTAEHITEVQAVDAYNRLQTLPIGWDNNSSIGPSAIIGWLLTASATLFGAPFWFDTLKTLVRLRGTGTKPVDQPPHRTTEPEAKS
jgi:hypothetical protein